MTIGTFRLYSPANKRDRIYHATCNRYTICPFPQPSPHRRTFLTSSFQSLPRLNLLDGLHDDWEILTLSSNQQARPDIADSACPEPLCLPDPFIHTDVDRPGWERLIRSPLAVHERVTLITAILSNRDEIEIIRRLDRDAAQTFIDVIYEVNFLLHLRRTGPLTLPRTSALSDQTLDDLGHALRMRCLRLVCKICGDHALLPESLAIPLSCDRTKDPLYYGGFADIWKGTSRGLEVAVKVLKSYQCNREQTRRVGDSS